MKNKLRIILLGLVVLLFVSCRTPEEKPKDDTNVANETGVPKGPIDIYKYLKENIDKTDKEKNTTTVIELEDRLTENLSVIENIVLQEDIQNYLMNNFKTKILTTEDIETITNDDIKEEIKKIYNSGYLIAKIGSDYLPVINYREFAKFNEHYTDSTSEYFKLKVEDMENPVLASGKILIEPVEILYRINKIEKFINVYPDFPRNNDFTVRYQSWLYLLLTGTSLNPIADENGNINPPYKALLENVLNPKTNAEKAIKDGYNVLSKNRFLMDSKTMSSLREIVKNKTEELRVISK